MPLNSSPIKITAISGSLRRQSSNTSLIHALYPLAPETMEISIFEGIGDLPHFNPDMDGDDPAPSVVRLRDTIRQADGVIISTPEYAHGVPGVLKNALDWLVSSGEFVYKPVAVVSGSPMETGGEKAHESLQMTLRMMTADLVEGGSFTVPFLNQKLRGGEIKDEELNERLKGMLGKLEEAVREAAANGMNGFR
ncbi:hypothetical protein BCV73_19420 [Paenibacillus sp. SSG-1]|uniref:NADPH-dependent FMN reductase n=1 Tax=Paenibacillus sp. SSG-1 TaxID=1443669 RepID=UPI000B7E655F|nr:NADPH-dependent FMN reductase [Paenibacillus sp. SSG-1]OXL85028.1 hypothetical protein BCV73_19420 [Paenibacillus sp. SSG-1]